MPVPSLPNLTPPFAPDADLNCLFKVKNNTSTGGFNSRGNRIITFDETTVSGWAIREETNRLLETIGASVEETPIRIWIQTPNALPANFASFNNVYCELTLAGIKQVGILRPVPLGHPFVPANFQFVIGAFKGAIAS